jgi:hypothetical protein
LSDRDPNAPERVEREYTLPTRAALLEAATSRLEKSFETWHAEVDRRFREGAATFAELRGEIQRVRDLMDGKVSARHSTVKAEVDERLKTFGDSLDTLANEVAPRATTLRLVALVAGLLSALATAGYLYFSKPDKSEVRELEQRLRSAEMRITTIDARLGARGATP